MFSHSQTYSHSQNATRTIVVRLTVFFLTAGLANLVFYPHKEVTNVSIASINHIDSVAFSPVEVVSVPEIDFPKSLKKLDAIDFWITASFVVGANGEVQDVRVPADLDSTMQDRSFAEEVLAKVSPNQRVVVQERLFEILRNQVEQTRFKPRISEGTPFSTQVYMSSNFQWDGKLCWKVETVFMTSSGSIWDRIDANHQLEPCYGF